MATVANQPVLSTSTAEHGDPHVQDKELIHTLTDKRGF